jgi:hypothetical protein
VFDVQKRSSGQAKKALTEARAFFAQPDVV